MNPFWVEARFSRRKVGTLPLILYHFLLSLPVPTSCQPSVNLVTTYKGWHKVATEVGITRIASFAVIQRGCANLPT